MTTKFGLVLGGALLAVTVAGCSVEAPETGSVMSATQSSLDRTAHDAFEKGKGNLAGGHLGLALQDFKKALAREPRSVPILNAVAVTYDRLGRHDIAELYFDRALAIDPGYSVALNNVGYSMLTRGRYEEALIYFEQALKEEHLAPAKRLIKGNMKMAMDRLRLARQRGETATVTKASLDNRVVIEKDDCKLESRHAVSQIGERVFKLITDPGDADRARAATTGEIRCGNTERPRVAMLNTAATATAAARVHQLTTVAPEKPAAVTAAPEKPAVAVIAPKKSDTVTIAQSPNTSERPAETTAQAVAKKASSPVPPAAAAEPLTIEVSNGAGRNKLAARMRGYLESRGLNVSFLTNAASFDNKWTTIFFKTGQRHAAERFAKQLPISVELVESDKNYADIRIRLGADILDFDKKVLFAVAMGEPNA